MFVTFLFFVKKICWYEQPACLILFFHVYFFILFIHLVSGKYYVYIIYCMFFRIAFVFFVNMYV